MTHKFILNIAMTENEDWHCVIHNGESYSGFQSDSLNSLIEEARLRMTDRIKQNEVSPIVGLNGKAIRS